MNEVNAQQVAKRPFNAVLLLMLFLLLASLSVGAQTLSFSQPAQQWTEALPVGNGRLAMMVWGGDSLERLSLNESTLWSGEYNPQQNPQFGKERLDSLRQLFLQGDIREGNRIAAENLVGDTHCFGTHLPMGDLIIKFSKGSLYCASKKNKKLSTINSPTSLNSQLSTFNYVYKRELDLPTATANSSFVNKGVAFQTTAFASNPDDVLVLHVEADQPHAVSFSVSLDLLREALVRKQGRKLVWTGKVSFPKQGPGGVGFRGWIRAKTKGGRVSVTDSTIVVTGANSATLYIDIQTDYQGKIRSTRPPLRRYARVLKRHIRDFSRLFNRVTLDLGPQAERETLFFHFSRYLFLSASRENSPLPVALQGMFNDNLACNMPWTNDYHLDINTQQNYWLSCPGNMAESDDPLLRYVAHLAEYGAQTAREVYGCRGWCAHTTANIFGFTAPSAAIGWGLFPTAGAWLATQLWTHYQYTADRRWLRKAYPLLRGSAEFLLDYLFLDPQSGYLLTGPSISPENGFLYDGHYTSASLMPTVDLVLTREILSSVAQSADILHKDMAFADSCRNALALLPPLQIGSNGDLQEWFYDYPQAVPNHRHTSHLLCLYPFRQIDPDTEPELAQAAQRSLEMRLAAPGWEDTEWSRANAICYYARLKEPQKAYSSLQTLLSDFTADNLMTLSPAGIAMAENDIFCFDGNTAGAAGMVEMLLQTVGDSLYVLPCLPEEWSTGSFTGLCAPGGITVDASWKDRQITHLSITRP